jgi:hypothetical protein
MNFHIMPILQKCISASFALTIAFLFFNCKKNSAVGTGTGGSGSTGIDTTSSTTWFFRLVVNDSAGNNLISTYVKGNGPEGETAKSPDSIGSILTGGNTIGSNGSYNGVPGMNMVVSSGGCDTGVTTNPCYVFLVGVQSIKTGQYLCNNNDCDSCVEALNNNEIIFKPSPIFQYNTYWLVDTLNSMGNCCILVPPPANVAINITQVGNVGQNIRGNFIGTMIQTNVSTNARTIQTVNVSGSFNVYRSN